VGLLSHVWSDSITGRYHRLIGKGIYDFLVSAYGYSDTLLTDIYVYDMESTEMDIILFPRITDKIIIKDSIAISPNPFFNQMTIDIWTELPEEITISLFDPAGRKIITESSISITGGYHHILLDGSGLSPGLYILKITRPSGKREIKVLKME